MIGKVNSYINSFPKIFCSRSFILILIHKTVELPIRSPLGLPRRLFDLFWSPILEKVTLSDSNHQLLNFLAQTYA